MIESIAKMLFSLLIDFLFAGVAMVALHFAHHSNAHVPAFGYITCFWLLTAIGSVVAAALIGQHIADA